MRTGSEIREFRRDKNWPINYLAKLLGISIWKLQTIECSAKVVPRQIAERIETLVRAIEAGTITSNEREPRHRFRDFRRSTSFLEMPPFSVVPACPCGDALCVLAPTGDGDWDGKHLWKFVGRVCHKTRYVDSEAVVVARPVRRPPRDLPLDDFRHWTNFSIAPPFPVLPNCPCGKARCRLRPRQDFDREGRHLWKFKGWKCQRVSYVDSDGALVPIPSGLARDPSLRDPMLQGPCSKCGRRRFLNRQFRSRLGCRIAILSCLRRPGDSPNQEHDPPEYFRVTDGRISRLTPEDHEKLRGRSKYPFVIPTCNLEGCQRLGKRMERSSEILPRDANGRPFRLAVYCCRPVKPANRHYAYRVLPNGEVADRVAKACYRWLDAVTSEPHETVHKKRAIRADRIMPALRCPKHDCLLKQGRGPWKYRGQQHWRATCIAGRERYRVGIDGSMQPIPSRRGKEKRGRPVVGMTDARKNEGSKLLQRMVEFARKHGRTRGAQREAASVVYKAHDGTAAYETARKTISQYCQMFPDDLLVREWSQIKTAEKNRN